MLPRYHEWNYPTAYLELHDNRTLWEVDNEFLPEEAYYYLVEDAISRLSEEIGTPVYLLGRSGRHVCIEDNARNRLNYWRYRAIALAYERDVIADANAYECED